MKIFKRIQNYLGVKYVALFEFLTLKLVLLVNQMMRKLIILKDKDPDYVAPPPAPVKVEEPSKFEQGYERLNKFYSSTRTSLDSGDWIKYPEQHPVVKSRAMFKDKQATLLEGAVEDMAACSGPVRSDVI